MKRNRGFTLIEILVVIAILGILITAGFEAFTISLIKGRDSTRKGNLRAISSALELYYNDNGRYPVGDANGSIVGCGGGTGSAPNPAPGVCPINGAFQDANSTLYMASLPTDPVSSLKYFYVSASGTQFQIYTHLENNQDSTIFSTSYNCNNGGANISCNWGLASPNVNP
jgi:prepilin-type N-terminal cleavage/methylation domain-containing protein